jgi:hypothetical protein
MIAIFWSIMYYEYIVLAMLMIVNHVNDESSVKKQNRYGRTGNILYGYNPLSSSISCLKGMIYYISNYFVLSESKEPFLLLLFAAIIILWSYIFVMYLNRTLVRLE